MRSSGSKPGKSVSICNESYPNGPCTKKEGEVESRADDGLVSLGTKANKAEEDDIDEDQVHSVASEVVENVVRLASRTANERRAEAVDASKPSTSHTEPDSAPAIETNQNQNPVTTVGSGSTASSSKNDKLQRLPTFQIDTVPSLPSSPTEWQSPTKEDAIAEEDEEDILDEDHIDIVFGSPSEDSKESQEIQEFATSYINDLIEKAMALAEEKQRSQNTEVAKEIASKIVGDVIIQANDKAFERLKADLTFPENVPSIQIDIVPSLPPSPTLDEEEEEQNKPPNKKVVVKRKKFIFHDEDDVVQVKTQPAVRKLITHSEAPSEIKDFASSYVKDIISKAITMAEEKLVSAVPFNFEDVDMMKTSGPWYIRAREAFMNILRSACFCPPRRDDS